MTESAVAFMSRDMIPRTPTNRDDESEGQQWPQMVLFVLFSQIWGYVASVSDNDKVVVNNWRRLWWLVPEFLGGFEAKN